MARPVSQTVEIRPKPGRMMKEYHGISELDRPNRAASRVDESGLSTQEPRVSGAVVCLCRGGGTFYRFTGYDQW
jgi:hypothetical protein